MKELAKIYCTPSRIQQDHDDDSDEFSKGMPPKRAKPSSAEVSAGGNIAAAPIEIHGESPAESEHQSDLQVRDATMHCNEVDY